MKTKEKKLTSVKSAPSDNLPYFCKYGGHEIAKLHYRDRGICRGCSRYFLLDSDDHVIRELSQKEFYENAQ